MCKGETEIWNSIFDHILCNIKNVIRTIQASFHVNAPSKLVHKGKRFICKLYKEYHRLYTILQHLQIPHNFLEKY